MSLLDTASLIVTPNAYKEGTLYSVIPSDGSGDLSVTRATTATRVNSQGLVELVPYNLLRYSKDLSSGYTFNQCSATSSVTAPDGTNNARRITNGSTTTDVYFEQSVTFSPSVYTWSVYVKQGTAATATIKPVHVGLGADVSLMTFTFATQTITSSGSITSTGFTNEGNGWFRIYCSVTIPSSVVSLRGRFGNPNTPNVYNDWAYPQLVEGSVAKDYQKTETRLNIPRLDYSNGTCPSILVEPQRTNLLTYSSSFDNASWTKSSTTITANTTISPSGVQDAETAVFGSNGQVYKPISSNAVNTFSTYVKKGTNRYFSIQLETNSVVYRAIYDLDTTSVTFTGTNTSASITDEGNGWFRVSVVNTTSDAIAYTTLQAASSGTSVSGGSGTFYIWGAQLEAGSYATSYIPTTSASVTRNADVISKTGISSLIGQTEGTLFVEFNSEYLESYTQRVITLSDGTSNNVLGIQITAANELVYFVQNGGALQVLITKNSPAITLGQNVKIAAAYKANDFVLYVNGVQVGADTSGSVPATSLLRFAEHNGTSQYIGKINATALWKQRLTNDELAQLTTI